MYDVILIRFGEMTLKGKNYRVFLKQMNKNLQRKLVGFPDIEIVQEWSRTYLYLHGTNADDVIEVLNTVVGLSSYSLCINVVKDFDEIANEAAELIRQQKKLRTVTFKVETNRSDKSFPYTSIQISQEVARRILPQVDGLKVDVHNPELTLSIDFRNEGVYIYTSVISGLGGFPGGLAGKGLLMMSGGIDSPVAGFLTLKKGVNLTAIHFYSPPHTSELSLQKVVDLVQRLSHYTFDGKMDLLVVPFTEIQEEIYKKVDPAYIITIMRRLMYKIAHKICMRDNISSIINGESIGQVASQTIESMMVVNDVTTLPVLRPLLTYDKVEIINLAKQIKTYDISIRPYDDCCTVFIPKRPIIKPTLKRTIQEEERCDFGNMITKAIDNITVYNIDATKKLSIITKGAEEKFKI